MRFSRQFGLLWCCASLLCSSAAAGVIADRSEASVSPSFVGPLTTHRPGNKPERRPGYKNSASDGSKLRVDSSPVAQWPGTDPEEDDNTDFLPRQKKKGFKRWSLFSGRRHDAGLAPLTGDLPADYPGAAGETALLATSCTTANALASLHVRLQI